MLDPVSGLDGFHGSKGAAVGMAVRGLLADFRASRKAASFTFAGVTFAERVTGRWGPTPATRLDLDADYDPTRHGGDGTSLAAGLAEAERVCGAFLGEKVDGLPSSAVVLLLTDGQCATVEETRRVAARLAGAPRVLLACAYFASGGTTDGVDLLRRICTQPAASYCTTVYDAGTLRAFWRRSMTAVPSLSAVTPAGGRPALP
jgi:hypothetical protein